MNAQEGGDKDHWLCESWNLIIWNTVGTDSILWLVLLQASLWYSYCLMWHQVRMKRLKPKKKYSFCLPTAALNACAGLLKGKSLCIQHLRVTKRYRTDQAGREACRYLVQLAAQGRATSKTRSGCLGPCSISFWSPQKRRLHRASWQSHQGLKHTYWGKENHSTQLGFLLQFVTATFRSCTVHQRQSGKRTIIENKGSFM